MKALLRALTWPSVLAILSGCSGSAALPGRITPQSFQAQPCNRWRVVASAKPNSTNANLYGVDGRDAGDIWSVGAYESSSSFRTFAEHWNGAVWNLEQTPNVGSGENDLVAVAALSASNVWAAGFSSPTVTSTTRTLVEHWNGSVWTAITSPSPGQLSGLSDVKAVSANDIWAAGAYFNLSGNQQTLVEHWNGKAWRIVSSPSPGASYNNLSKLAIISPKNIWAVGSTSSGSTSQTLVEQWNGKTWQIVPSLNAPNSIYSDLAAVVAIDANDIWAVGSSESYASYETSTLIEHWSGSSWQIVPSPNAGTHGNLLAGIAAASANDLWSVGSYIDAGNFLPRTLIEHWSGTTWRIAKSPDPGSLEDKLSAIALVGTTSGASATKLPRPKMIRSSCA
jgi:hypothetical protein